MTTKTTTTPEPGVTTENWLEHDHKVVEGLCRVMTTVAQSPGDMAEAVEWFLGWTIGTIVEDEKIDDFMGELHSRIMVKLCILRENNDARDQMRQWAIEGPKAPGRTAADDE